MSCKDIGIRLLLVAAAAAVFLVPFVIGVGAPRGSHRRIPALTHHDRHFEAYLCPQIPKAWSLRFLSPRMGAAGP